MAPEIDEVLRKSGATVRDLTAIIAGTGPGPFTGLRVGLVTAASMGQALGIPAYGVCSLDAIGGVPGQVTLAATDARRREVYWALYDQTGARVEGPHVDLPDVVARKATAAAVAVGDGALKYADRLGLKVLDEPRYPQVDAFVRAGRRPGPSQGAERAAHPAATSAARTPSPREGTSRCCRHDRHAQPAALVAHRRSCCRSRKTCSAPRSGRPACSGTSWPAGTTTWSREDENRILGYGGLAVNGDEAWIQNIAVVRDAQRQGIGRTILEALLAEAARRKAPAVLLEVAVDNAPAQKLYATYGFEPIGVRRGYYQPSNTDALVMRT